MAISIAKIPDSIFREYSNNNAEMLEEAILNGILLPDNATNGDVIKALFPDIEIADIPCLDKVYTGISFRKYIGANIDCMREWWDAPYNAESEDGEDNENNCGKA